MTQTLRRWGALKVSYSTRYEGKSPVLCSCHTGKTFVGAFQQCVIFHMETDDATGLS